MVRVGFVGVEEVAIRPDSGCPAAYKGIELAPACGIVVRCGKARKCREKLSKDMECVACVPAAEVFARGGEPRTDTKALQKVIIWDAQQVGLDCVSHAF